MDTFLALNMPERASMLGCVAWIPVTVWTVAMVGWMISGEVDVLFGACALITGLILGFFAFLPPVPGLEPVFIFAAFTMVVAFPIVRATLNRRALAQVDLEVMERAYEAIELKPNNLGAAFRIAKMAWARGLAGHAIAIGDQILPHLPIQSFREEHRTVQMWKASPVRPDAYRPISCVECGESNAPGLLHCQRCRSRVLLHAAQGRFLGKAMTRKLLSGWVALMLALVGIPVALASLAPVLAALAIAGLAALVVLSLVFGFREPHAA